MVGQRPAYRPQQMIEALSGSKPQHCSERTRKISMNQIVRMFLLVAGLLQATAAYADFNSADRQLNAIYSNVLEALSASNRDQLRASQRNWIKYRDSECRYQQINFSIMVSEADCKELLTRQRIGILARQRKWLKQSAHADSVKPSPSCDEEIGKSAAQHLVEQCRQVSPATRPPCNGSNSCQMISEEIKRGCALISGKKPGYCL